VLLHLALVLEAAVGEGEEPLVAHHLDLALLDRSAGEASQRAR
jgi:hypothetical protein